jgi:hypothetical protein
MRPARLAIGCEGIVISGWRPLIKELRPKVGDGMKG